MNVNTLTFRNGEQPHFGTGEPPPEMIGEHYRVCLLKIEDVPQPWSSRHDVYPYTVLCAAQYPEDENRWGWVALDSATKHEIGITLEGLISQGNIEDGEWIWMIVEPAYARKEAS